MKSVQKFATPRDDVITSICSNVQEIVYGRMETLQRMPYIISVQADVTDAEIAHLVPLLRLRLNLGELPGVFTCDKVNIAPAKYTINGFLPAIVGLSIGFEQAVSDAKIAELSGKIDAVKKPADSAAPTKKTAPRIKN